MADDENAQCYEDEHVHNVYDQIASHFSSTRYKPWPIIERFLLDLPAGSIGLDVGCGNGKYLTVNKDVFIVGSDRSSNLVEFAKAHQPHDATVADMLSLPHPNASFDFALCIAAVHHLATPARRVAAIAYLLETLRSRAETGPIVTAGGLEQNGSIPEKQNGPARALIYVWALEQKDSRRGWDKGDEQDVMVPWVLKPPNQKQGKKATKTKGTGYTPGHIEEQGDDLRTKPLEQTFHRYYHLYRSGELEQDIRAAGGRVLSSGYEKDNWWAVAARAEG